MAKGYHSRSPEELKEYLGKVNKPQKKKRWVQIVMYIDIFILMVVFYFVAKNSNPLIGNDSKKSAKIDYKNFQIYLEKSSDFEKENANYFLVVKNVSDKNQTFPINKDMQFEYKILSDSGIVCTRNSVEFQNKIIKPKETDFFPFSISKNNFHALPKDCLDSLTVFSRGINKIFPKKSGKGYLVISKDGSNRDIILENESLEKSE